MSACSVLLSADLCNKEHTYMLILLTYTYKFNLLNLYKLKQINGESNIGESCS